MCWMIFGSWTLCLGCTAAARGSYVWFNAFIEQTNGASGTRYSMTCSGWHFGGRKWGGQYECENRLTDEVYLHSVIKVLMSGPETRHDSFQRDVLEFQLQKKRRLVTVWVVTLPTESVSLVHFCSINDKIVWLPGGGRYGVESWFETLQLPGPPKPPSSVESPPTSVPQSKHTWLVNILYCIGNINALSDRPVGRFFPHSKSKANHSVL